MPETSWSFHYWQPTPRWRLHQWLAKPDNPAMSPHAHEKTGTRHTDTQWKAEGGEGREQNLLNTPHIMLLLPTTMISKRYSPKHMEFHVCVSILKALTNWLPSLLVFQTDLVWKRINLRIKMTCNIHMYMQYDVKKLLNRLLLLLTRSL